tara:strand:- start:14259 stop:14453 length:195 start_codon:yes stop_codon:yes gene_type:complete
MSQIDVNVSKKKKAGKTKMTKGNGHAKKMAFLKAVGDNTFFGAGGSMGVGDKMVKQYKAHHKLT